MRGTQIHKTYINNKISFIILTAFNVGLLKSRNTTRFILEFLLVSDLFLTHF